MVDTLGYTEYSTLTLGGNRFATYVRDNNMYHVYWMASNRELNVVMSTNQTLPERQEALTTGKAPVLTQLHGNSSNGLCFVVELDDGSFIVFDGGYADSSDAEWNNEEVIYNFLAYENDREDGILIRAWILTHAHGDHYGAFHDFANGEYADLVTLMHVYYSPLKTASAAYFASDLATDLAKFDGASAVVLHTGMAINLRNLKMEVLMTPDELYIDGDQADYNNSSMVVRLVDGNGYSMIFLADTAAELGDKLVAEYGSALRSDMCQVAHHGYESAKQSLYEAIGVVSTAPTNGDKYVRYLWYPCTPGIYCMADGTSTDGLGTMRERNTVVLEFLESSVAKRLMPVKLGQDYSPINSSGKVYSWLLKFELKNFQLQGYPQMTWGSNSVSFVTSLS